MKRRQGFSLIELLVGMGLSGAVGLAVVNLLTNTQRSAQQGIARQRVRDHSALIRQALSKPLNCTCSVEGRTVRLGALGSAPVQGAHLTSVALPSSTGCLPPRETLASTGLAVPGANPWSVDRVWIDEVADLGDGHLTGVLKVAFSAGSAQQGTSANVDSFRVAMEGSVDTVSGTAQLSRCVADFAGSQASNGTRAGTVNGNEITGLIPGGWYMVTVMGTIRNAGNGAATLWGPSLTRCGPQSAQVLVATPSEVLNWPDGNAPQSHTFAVRAPEDGCIRGRTDDGSVNAVVIAMSYLLAGTPDTDPARAFDPSTIKTDQDRITGLDPEAAYLVVVDAVLDGQNVTSTNPTPGSIPVIRLDNCGTPSQTLAQTDATLITTRTSGQRSTTVTLFVRKTGGCIQASILPAQTSSSSSGIKSVTASKVVLQ